MSQNDYEGSGLGVMIACFVVLTLLLTALVALT